MPNSHVPQPKAVSVRSAIYRALYESDGSCSKKELAERCGVSMPTLYQHLNGLIEAGLICYTDQWQSTGGRKAQKLDIVPASRFSMGVSLNENRLRMVAADLRLQELAYQEKPFRVQNCLTGKSPKVDVLLEEFLDESGLDRSRLLGVCVTVPGLVSEDRRTIDFAPTLGVRNLPAAELLGEIPYPLQVENDGSASGHAEYFARRNPGNMAYLSLENGVGGAVLVGRKPYSGDHNRSGEFGHICVEPGGMPCACGKLGCLEPYCSAGRIETSLGVSLEEFFLGVENHNPEYTALLYDMLRHLAVGINSIRMALDCDVVLGGFLSEYLMPYLPALRRYVLAGNPFDENADFVQFSKLRRHITPLGAALYYIRRFVESI